MPTSSYKMSATKLRPQQIEFRNSLFNLLKEAYLIYLRRNNSALHVTIEHEDMVIKEFLENGDEDILKNDSNFNEEFRKRLIYHNLY